MIELDWEGIENLLDKLPEGVIVNGESKVSIPNTNICKIAFACIKQDDEYYYVITDILTIDDVINSMIRIKLTNMLFNIMVDEFESMQSNIPVDYSKEKEAIARVIKLLEDLDKK